QMLVDIYGQHEFQSILRTTYQMDLIDSVAGLMDLRAQVKTLYQSWARGQKELEELYGQARERERQRDFLTYQVKEITAAALKPGEDEELLRERDILNNAARLAQGAASVYDLLFGDEGRSAYDRISQAAVELEAMGGIDATLEPLQNLLKAAAAQVEEVARNIRRYGEKLE
ncbi:MAG: DNA repair protein RecN, partial [Moorella sp. (in: Bacteria)]|nr:DNA repair protein RecN [Moorella sp. (in: firmicutes)]